MRLSAPLASFPALAWLVACGLFSSGLSSCAQTDVVARAALIECLDEADCAGDAECTPASCPSLAIASALCGAGSDPSLPLVQVGDGCGADTAGAPAFRFALCSCTDFVTVHPLRVVADPELDPELAGPDSVGIVGELSTDATVEIAGSLQLSGDLTLPSDDALALGGVLVQTPNPACNCQEQNLLDVAAAVEAQATDDAALAAGFDPAGLEDVTSDETLVLSCGHYRVARIAGPADLRIRALGRVALFVEGDLALDGGMEVVVEEGASLDLFVAGNVRVGAAWLLGGREQAGRVRVYVGGSGTIDLAAEASIGGPLYAPRAELVTRGDLTLYGPLFVRRAAPGGELAVHAAPATTLSCGG